MSLEILLSDLVITIWTLISVFGVSMAFRTSASDDPLRRRRWFWSLAILAIIGLAANHFTKALNAQTQTTLQNKLDTSIGNEGRMEGKLGLIGDMVGKFNCPGAKEIEGAIRQAIPSQNNPPNPASHVKAELPNRQLLLAIAPGVAQELDAIGSRWFVEDDNIVSLGEKRTGQTRDEVAKRYSELVQPLLPVAEYLRQQLIQQLNSSNQTPEDESQDKKEAAAFASFARGQSGGWRNLQEAGRYLYDLCRRVKEAPNPVTP